MGRKFKGSKTLAELMAILEKDEDYLRRHAESERQMAERSARLRLEEEPLLAELRAVGFHLESVWEFVNTGEPYPAAVPILMKHLYFPYSEYTKDGIARALAVPDSIPYWQELKDLFYQTPDGGVKQGLACALMVIAMKTKRYQETLEILRDETQGEARGLLLGVFSRSRDPKIHDHLKEFVDDPELGWQARHDLKKREQSRERKAKLKAAKKA